MLPDGVRINSRRPGPRDGLGPDSLGPGGLTAMGLGSLGRVEGALFARFASRADLPGDASLGQVVGAVHAPGDQAWDGQRSMCLACGEGRDFPAGDDPDAEKAALEASYCDRRVREPFIAALALASERAGSA